MRCPALPKGLVSAVSLTAESPRPYPEERATRASRRTGAAHASRRARLASAPQHEAERGCSNSYPPAYEDVLIELGPVLVFADIARPVGEIEPLKPGAGARFCCVGARRVVAKLLV